MQTTHPQMLVGTQVFVLAHNHYQFHLFKQYHGYLKPRYVSDARMLRGLGHCTIVCLDGWRHNPIYDDRFVCELGYRLMFKIQIFEIPDEVWLKITS